MQFHPALSSSSPRNLTSVNTDSICPLSAFYIDSQPTRPASPSSLSSLSPLPPQFTVVTIMSPNYSSCVLPYVKILTCKVMVQEVMKFELYTSRFRVLIKEIPWPGMWYAPLISALGRIAQTTKRDSLGHTETSVQKQQKDPRESCGSELSKALTDPSSSHPTESSGFMNERHTYGGLILSSQSFDQHNDWALLKLLTSSKYSLLHSSFTTF